MNEYFREYETPTPDSLVTQKYESEPTSPQTGCNIKYYFM